MRRVFFFACCITSSTALRLAVAGKGRQSRESGNLPQRHRCHPRPGAEGPPPEADMDPRLRAEDDRCENCRKERRVYGCAVSNKLSPSGPDPRVHRPPPAWILGSRPRMTGVRTVERSAVSTDARSVTSCHPRAFVRFTPSAEGPPPAAGMDPRLEAEDDRCGKCQKGRPLPPPSRPLTCRNPLPRSCRNCPAPAGQRLPTGPPVSPCWRRAWLRNR